MSQPRVGCLPCDVIIDETGQTWVSTGKNSWYGNMYSKIEVARAENRGTFRDSGPGAGGGRSSTGYRPSGRTYARDPYQFTREQPVRNSDPLATSTAMHEWLEEYLRKP